MIWLWDVPKLPELIKQGNKQPLSTWNSNHEHTGICPNCHPQLRDVFHYICRPTGKSIGSWLGADWLTCIFSGFSNLGKPDTTRFLQSAVLVKAITNWIHLVRPVFHIIYSKIPCWTLKTTKWCSKQNFVAKTGVLKRYCFYFLIVTAANSPNKSLASSHFDWLALQFFLF